MSISNPLRRVALAGAMLATLSSVATAASAQTARMLGTAADFFGMPWPSDHRRQANGTLELNNYPGIGQALFGVGSGVVRSFQPTLTGYGTNSAAYFTFTGPLDAASFPAPSATVASGSPIMLVDLDDPTPERVPVLLDFKGPATPSRPANLLTVLPLPGHTLAPGTRYAVILFNNLSGSGLTRAPLLDRLEAGSSTGTGLRADKFNQLREHKARVDAYVSAHTDRQPSEVVAFAVYTTQPIGREMSGVATAVRNLSDDQVLTRIKSLSQVQACQRCTAATCKAAEYDAVIEIPHFQQPTTLTIIPFFSITSGGGQISLSGDVANVQSWKDASMRILVPCHDVPAGGWPTVFRADGTGADYASGAAYTEWMYNGSGLTLDQVVASIVPYQGATRQDPNLVRGVRSLVDLFGSTPESRETLIAGLLYYFPFNPVSARNNQIQNAADALFAKRVLDVLARAAASRGIQPAQPNGFATDPQRATLFGQSQGAASAPLALTVPAAQGGFRNAYLNAPGGSLMFEENAIRSDVRPLFETIFRFQPGEFDRFHPIAHLQQTALEAGSAINYARAVATEHLLITAGFEDGCATRESTSALATRLAHFGKLEAGDTRAAYSDGAQHAFIEGYLPKPLRALPTSGNLPGGATGIFLLLPGHHTERETDARGAIFLHYLGFGATMKPPVGGVLPGEYREDVCTLRSP